MRGQRLRKGRRREASKKLSPPNHRLIVLKKTPKARTSDESVNVDVSWFIAPVIHAVNERILGKVRGNDLKDKLASMQIWLYEKRGKSLTIVKSKPHIQVLDHL